MWPTYLTVRAQNLTPFTLTSPPPTPLSSQSFLSFQLTHNTHVVCRKEHERRIEHHQNIFVHSRLDVVFLCTVKYKYLILKRVRLLINKMKLSMVMECCCRMSKHPFAITYPTPLSLSTFRGLQ